MITEDYVSFETAKLLKEKGFDVYVKSYYNKAAEFNGDMALWNYNITDFRYSAPTLQMAMKWLREVHNLHCNSDYDIILGWYCQITSLKETIKYDYEEMKHYYPDKHFGFSSPEEACEKAIKFCLENLI